MHKATFVKRISPILVLGLLISLYLLHHHLEVRNNLSLGASICNLNDTFDCDAVARSSYSEIFNIPIALFGATYYLSLIFAVLFWDLSEKKNRSAFLFYVLLAVLPTVLMAGTSFFIIKKVCLFCSMLYFLNILLFSFVALFYKNDGSYSVRIIEGSNQFLSFVFNLKDKRFLTASIGAIVFLFFSQGLYVNNVLYPRYVNNFGKKVLTELVQAWEAEVANFSSNEINALEGAISMGNKNASIQIVEFSDFECPFCQKLAPILAKVYQENKENINLVLLNYPLDKKCNKSIQSELHKNSCAFSELVTLKALNNMDEAFILHEEIMQSQATSLDPYKDDLKLLKSDSGLKAKVKSALSKQIDFGIKQKIQGTPAIFINGKRVFYNNFFQIEEVIKLILLKTNSK